MADVQTFRVARRFHAGHSVLGRALRRSTGDRRYAEALQILILTAFGLGVLLFHYLSWTLLPAEASPAVQGGLALVEIGLVMGGAGLGVVGVQPALTVTVDAAAQTLTLRQGPRQLALPMDAIDAVGRRPARAFHRHERRYAATRVFIGRWHDAVVLLRTARGPVAIGLATPADQAALIRHLETACATARTENAVL